MNRWLAAFFVVLLLGGGCGEFGSDQASEDTTVTPPVTHGEQLTLLSTVQLPDKRWEYHLSLDLSAVAGDKSTPFYEANFSNWGAVKGVNIDGRYDFKIQTYDRSCSLVYGGNLNLQSWADITDSDFYVATQDALGFGLQNGQLVKWNDYIQTQYGGTATDASGVVGFTLEGDQLDIYFNLSHVAGSLANPYWFGDQTGFIKQPITLLDSRGWAKQTITIAENQVIRFTFGGDSAVDTTWAYIKNSTFYNSADDLIVVGRQGNTIVAR